MRTHPTDVPDPISLKISGLTKNPPPPQTSQIDFTPYVRGSGPPYYLVKGQSLTLRFKQVLLNQFKPKKLKLKSLSFYQGDSETDKDATQLLGTYTVPTDSRDDNPVTIYQDEEPIFCVTGNNLPTHDKHWVNVEHVEVIPSGGANQPFHFSLTVEATPLTGLPFDYTSDPVVINEPDTGKPPSSRVGGRERAESPRAV